MPPAPSPAPCRAPPRRFTLLEMLALLVVLLIVSTMAAPAMRTMITHSALAGDQGRLMSALSQARALAMRERACYCLAINNLDPARNWYAILRLPPGTLPDAWELGGTLSGLTLADAEALAGRFLAAQEGPRLRTAAGVRIGAFNPDPSTGGRGPEWLETTGGAPTPGGPDAFDAFLRDGFAPTLIRFSPRGEVASVCYPSEMTVAGEGANSRMTVTIARRDRLDRADLRLVGKGDGLDPLRLGANPFFVTDGGPYFVLGLSAAEKELAKRPGSAGAYYAVSRGPHVGIGLHRGTGIAVARKEWPPDE